MDILDIYEDVQKDVQAIYRSRLQAQILLSLYVDNNTLAKLREVTGSTSQALLPKIRILESNKLIESVEHEYRLTPLGKIVASRVADSVMTMGTVLEHKEFWKSHYMEAIPQPLLESIGSLYDSKIVSDTNVEIFNVYHHFLDMIKKADHIYGITAIMSSGHADILGERIQEGIPVKLIVTKSVIEELRQQPYIEQIHQLQKLPNFQVFMVDNDINLGFTVTDKCLSLGLYKSDGITYDTTTDLFSYDETAIKWGEKLFEYYLHDAVELDLI